MYVCVCKGVTDTHIKEAIQEGDDSLRSLRIRFGLGTQCGRCVDCTCSILSEQLEGSEATQPIISTINKPKLTCIGN